MIQLNRSVALPFFSLTILFVLFLSGCSSKDPLEPTELLSKEEKERLEISLDTPENQLLEDGKKYYNSELYTLARQNFESLRTGYPNSPFVDFAEIKIADCMFEAGSYTDAAKSYEDFTKRRPTHPSNAYMLYRAAQSQQLSHTGVGRDPTPLKKAIEIYDRILRDYPNSEYQSGIIQKKKEAVEALVAHEQRIEKYYTKKDLDQAARARASNVEASLVPVLSSLQALAKDSPTGSEDSKEVPEGIEIEKNTPESKQTQDSISVTSRLTKVICQSKNNRGVYLYFDTKLSNSGQLPKRILNKDGIISVQIPNVFFPNQVSDCFDSGDLILASDGHFEIKAFSDATLTVLDNSAGLFFAIPQ
jgi:outer membrane protein assembly factor BamD